MKAVRSLAELTQLRPEERAALQDYLTRLRRRFGSRVLQVILFGSRARGEGDAESDLDVLVVADDKDWHVHQAIADESVEPWLLNRALISPITMEAAEYEKLRQWQTLFYRNVEREGLDLWTANPA